MTDGIAHTRELARVPYDPDTLRDLLAPHFPFVGGNKPNFLEFNLVYQAWHALIPDNIQLNGSSIPLQTIMWSPQLFNNYSIAELATSFADTPMAKYGPHNFPFFVRGVTEDALRNERAQRLKPYNSYREFVGMEPLNSFDQLAVDNWEEVAELYNHDIDQLDFLTGVIADSNPSLPGNLLGDVQLIIVAIFALHDLASNALILNPELWGTQYLTVTGLQFVKDFEFRDFLGNLTDQSYPCSFRTSGSTCHEPEQWKTPDKVGSFFLTQSGACSYVGVDLTEWYFHENGYMRLHYLAFFASMGIITFVYILIFTVLSYVWPLAELAVDLREDAGPDAKLKLVLELHNTTILSHRIRLCSLIVSLLLCIFLVVPASIFWYQLMSDPYWFQSLGENIYNISVWTVPLVASHFLGEVALRLGHWRQNLSKPFNSSSSMLVAILLHHVAYFAMTMNFVASTDIAVFKIGSTLLTFWFWEWPLFAAFLVVRIHDAIGHAENWAVQQQDRKTPCSVTRSAHPVYKVCILYGLPLLVILYFASRFLESAYIFMLVVCIIQRNVTTAAVWVQATLAMLAIGLQYHAGYILIKFALKRKASLMKDDVSSGMATPEDWDSTVEFEDISC